MSSHSACCGFCLMERRRRKSCVSLTLRRPPPTWPIAFSRSSRSGRASATTPWRRRSSIAARKHQIRATSSSRGNCSHAPSRALAASRFKLCTLSPSGCCAFFPSRLMSQPISTFSTRANRGGSCSRRATRRSPNSPPRARARARSTWWRVNQVRPDFDELVTEALSRAEIFGAHDDALAYSTALRAPLGLTPGVTTASVETEMLGGDVGRLRRERWAEALDDGKKHDQNIAANLRAADQMAPPKHASRRCSTRFSRMAARASLAEARTARSRPKTSLGRPQRSRMICVASKTACSPCASAGARR